LIKSKNIFKTVQSEVKTGSTENRKIINITVEEKPTGEISLGAGVGTSGATMAFGVKENNFLGKGVMLDTNLQISKDTLKGQLTYSQPNFNYTDNTVFTSLTSTSQDYMSTYGYKTNTVGASFGTKFEQYENLYFSPSIGAELETLDTSSAASASLKKQEGTFTDVNFNYLLDYDLRNQRYQTTDGFRNSFSQEIPIISETKEITNAIQSTIYQKLSPESDMVGKMSLSLKAVNTLTDKDVRISKRLYIPQTKLRGFEAGKVGPLDKNDTTKFVGGNYYSTLNLSSTLPQIVPSLENFDVSIFFDAANLWGVDYDNNIDDSNKLRTSTGVALDIFTPIGPLSFSLSQALTKKSTDKTETFRFNLGTTF
ncbi:BamA/TamA family outer membrane protein, partial [Candidatus Pelagibacter sp.]|nr:BamA/TamA family outer membrane protein [Candidatus Pelagibacter sp.]